MSNEQLTIICGLVVTLFAQWCTYKKAENAENRAKEASEKTVLSGKINSEKIDQVAEANKQQHLLMNSRLDEMKRIIEEAALARGILQGKAESKAEGDALKAAVMEVASKLSVTAPAPGPVVVIPAADPLPVVITDPNKKE